MTRGIWLTREEIKALPMSGPAWSAVKAAATKIWDLPDLSDQDDPTNCNVLAGALVAVRTDDNVLAEKVRAAVLKIPGTEAGGRTLALGRELAAYVIAADLVGLPADKEATFKSYLKAVRTKTLDSKTLVSTHEVRPNNWGTQAGLSLGALAVYVDDAPALARVAKVFKGWLGDRSSYAGFTYGELDWQADPAKPVGVNPKGSVKSGRSLDGALPEELRRAGGFVWPPPKENYIYTGLEGAVGLAVILGRFSVDDAGKIVRPGYPVWDWQDHALLRAYKWLHVEANYPATGNDIVQIYLINAFEGTSFPVSSPAPIARAYGWTDWTHAVKVVTPPPPPPPPPPGDLTASWLFHPDSDKWISSRVNPASGVAGAGATKADAMRDWLVRNPSQP